MKGLNIMLGVLLTAMVAMAAQVSVSMIDFAFSPDSVNISPGDEIVWTNNGYYVHTSTSGMNGVPDGVWNSGDVSPGGTYSRTFLTPGTFHYFCMHHYTSGMTGVAVVGTNGVGDSRSQAGNRTSIGAFPNPFRSAATFEFKADAGNRLVLNVYSVSGQLVRSLVAVQSNSGCYIAMWDGRDSNGREVSPGVYHCMSSAGSVVLTRLE